MAENIVHQVLLRAACRTRRPGPRASACSCSCPCQRRRLLGERNDAHCVSIEHKLCIAKASPTAVAGSSVTTAAIGEIVGEPNRAWSMRSS